MNHPWTVGEIIRNAFQAFQRSWLALILVSAVLAALFYACVLVSKLLDTDHLIGVGITSEPILSLARIGQVVLSIGVQLFSPLVLARVSLVAARGQQVRPRHVLVRPRHLLSTVGVLVLTLPLAFVGVIILMLALFISALVIAQTTSVDSVGTAAAVFGELGAPLLAILFGSPTAFYMTGFGLAQFFILDQGLGPVAASRAAWRACAGRRGSVAAYTLVAMAIVATGLCCCCVGALASAPLAMLGFAGIYLRSTAATATTGVFDNRD